MATPDLQAQAFEDCIFHLASRDGWADAQELGIYEVPSLAEEGFIHASTAQQVVATANRHYRGRTDLCLLVLQLDVLVSLDVPLVWEDTSGRGEEYPHLYSPLPVAAVREVLDFSPEGDGAFV